MKRAIALGIFLLLPSAALADCYCTCVNGQNVPICSSTLDLAPLCPPRNCPLEQPSLQPLNPPTLPPLGTRSCWQEQVYNNFTGMYEWQQVCR